KTSWEDQQQEFARFLLFEICALYESWCEACLQEMSLYSMGRAKQLQFGSFLAPNGSQMGVGQITNLLNASPSPALSGTIYPSLGSNRKNSFAHLEQLLICYRYFKEARNVLIHGASANANLIAAQGAYSAETATTLSVKEKPQFFPLVGNDLR